MDIDGYDGSELAPLNQDNSTIDNSLTANVDEVFNITSVETNDNLNNMGNEINDNSTLNEGNNEYIENIENMDSKNVVTTPDEPKKEVSNGTKFAVGGLLIFLIIWMIIGIIAFITSIVCFGYSGSMTEKVIGLLLALIFGPFYFLYFYLNKNYCGKKTSNTIKTD